MRYLLEETRLIWCIEAQLRDRGKLDRVLRDSYELIFFSSYEEFFSELHQKKMQHLKLPDLWITDAFVQGDAICEFIPKTAMNLPPWIVLSERNEMQVIQSCLRLGARDYFLKPFDPQLLKAKLCYWFDQQVHRLTLDPLRLLVSNSQGVEVKLTVKEFQIFESIYRAYPRSKCRSEIIREVWLGVRVVEKSFDVHLFKLRKKLTQLGCQIQFIEPINYMFVSGEMSN